MRFDTRAAEYERHAAPQARVVRELASRIGPGRGDEVVLELGAGSGLLTRELIAKGYRVVATDLSPAMIAAGKVNVPGAEWRRLDAFRSAEKPYDRLFSANLLQWAPSPAEAFGRLLAMLNPGGAMTHAILVSPTLSELNGLIGNASPVKWKSTDEWTGAAVAAGFRVTLAETVVFREPYRDARALLASLHGTGAVSAAPAHGAGHLRAIMRRYDIENAAPEGGVTATWAALLLEAERD